MKKKYLVLIMKVAISIVFIVIMTRNEKINFNLITTLVLNPNVAGCFLGLTFLQLVLASHRSLIFLLPNRICLRGIISTVKIVWAATFLNCVLPSSAFGELYKIRKFMSQNPELHKDNAVYSSIFSKVFSMLSLTLITFSAFFFIKKPLPFFPHLSFLLGVFLVGILLLVIFRKIILEKLSLVLGRFQTDQNRSFIRDRVKIFFKYHQDLFENKRVLTLGFMSCILIQFLNTISIIIIIRIAPGYDPKQLAQLFFLVPIGIFFIQLPISFFGLGVGNVAFASLLALAHIENGANIFSVFFVYSYVFNLIGVVPFFYMTYFEKIDDRVIS